MPCIFSTPFMTALLFLCPISRGALFCNTLCIHFAVFCSWTFITTSSRCKFSVNSCGTRKRARLRALKILAFIGVSTLSDPAL